MWLTSTGGIEHDRGCSLGELVLRSGERSLREVEERLVPRALSTRPNAIIALGDGALLRRTNRRRVEKAAELIYLRAPLDALWARLVREHETSRASHYPFVTSLPDSPEALRPLFETRERGYEGARFVVNVDGRSTWAVSEEVMDICAGLEREGNT